MRLLSLILALCISTPLLCAEIRPEDEVRLRQLSQDLSIPYPDLAEAMKQATYRPAVIDAISRPWEAKPWYQYRPLFVTPERIQAGVRFWRTNASWLEKAQQQYQVPAEIIVAIIGIETKYGSQMGTHPLLDSLYSLGFHYPARAPYFSKEFAQYTKLAKAQGWPLTEHKGSYAGAMGMGQFMPTSYLHFAVDFDEDGHIDLFNSRADAIGSVANYFAEHQWHYGEPVAHPVSLRNPEQANSHLTPGLKPDQSWRQLQAAGVSSRTQIATTRPVKLLKLDQAAGPEYWLTEHNFYVISRYNRSPLYAMAVTQLSESIAQAYHAE
ncbi:MAG: lytic murein transglycosylase B [Aeromonadaceae bacterium]